MWFSETVEELTRTARDVVGPDEPFDSHSYVHVAAGHWATLAGTLRQHEVEIAASEFESLTHDVELSDRVLARICCGRRPAR